MNLRCAHLLGSWQPLIKLWTSSVDNAGSKVISAHRSVIICAMCCFMARGIECPIMAWPKGLLQTAFICARRGQQAIRRCYHLWPNDLDDLPVPLPELVQRAVRTGTHVVHLEDKGVDRDLLQGH